MSRPESIYELPQHAIAPKNVLSIYDWEVLCQLPNATRLIGELHEAVRGIPGVRITASSIQVDRTPDELDRLLESAQDQWDRGQKIHEEWEGTGVPPAGTQRWDWQVYLRAEGLVVPEVTA